MIKVAIVENTAELRHFWTKILSTTEGYACVGSFSNRDAALLQLPLVEADVVLTDIQLSPTESGIELVARLKAQQIVCQFLVFTDIDNDAAIFDAIKAGANGYILKNTPPEKVLAAIAELHAGGAPMSAGIARRVLQSFQKPIAPSTHDYDRLPQYLLTSQEKKVLDLLAQGLFYKEVAEALGLKTNTIKQYCHAIYRKLAVANRTEALKKYFKR